MLRPSIRALMLACIASMIGCQDPSAPAERFAPSFTTTVTEPTVFAFGNHTCELRPGNIALCWGRNAEGQVGIRTNTPNEMTPQNVREPSGVSFVAMGGGAYHTCGLTSVGVAYCWGDNTFGELGTGGNTARNFPRLVFMPSGVTFEQISQGGGRHTCALTPDGAAYCWGNNDSGQTGTSGGVMPLKPRAVLMPAGIKFSRVSTGWNHTCAIGSDGNAYCWGRGGPQLGYGTSIRNRARPVLVRMPLDVTFSEIAAGRNHTCALTPAGLAYCWGDNVKGQVGNNQIDGTSYVRPVRVRMPSGVTFSQIAAGDDHTCALGSNAKAYCWGNNISGQIGNSMSGGGTEAYRPLSVTMPVGVSFTSVTAKYLHSCAMSSTNQAYCWGVNTNAQLGTNDFDNRNAPTAIMYAPPPSPDADGDGYTVAEGDCNDGAAEIHPGALDRVDAGFVDSNCDTLDGDVALAVFVATSGTDGGDCGTRLSPCRTVGAGLVQAGILDRRDVYVAQGTYWESVTLLDGINLYGGFAGDFSVRSTYISEISGNTGISLNGSVEAITLLADGLTAPTEVADLHIRGLNASGQMVSGDGRNSYAFIIRNTNAGILTVARNTIVSGNGSPGLAGLPGANASILSNASPGGNGGDSDEFATACNSTSRGLGGPGGGTGSAAGGAGGHGGLMDTNCGIFSQNLDASPGLAGANAVTNGVGYGTGRPGGSLCGAGQAGLAGRTLHGINGSGGSGSGVVNELWRGYAGTSGSYGSNGTGGGGGGGSGGCDDGTDSYGAGGGGGGAGGQAAGTPGGGGRSGGGSFGIYILASTPTLTDNTVYLGNGGNGGAGGAGGRGQPGGIGGSGGVGFGTGAGGNGGNGGNGGHSGSGGGGTGGVSAGIARVNSPSVVTTGTTFSGGTSGAGGSGGTRPDGFSAGDGLTPGVVNVLTL